jgi:hypothetical protein
MPVSKKRKKDVRKKARERSAVPAAHTAPGTPSTAPETGSGGLLTRMRGGFQSMAGASARKQSLLSKVVTWLIVALAVYFVARRFGILR